MSSADTIFFGGDIITMDEKNPNPEALAVGDKCILAVGKLEDILKSYQDTKTVLINLNQNTLMPGFIEPHQHAVIMALYQSGNFIDVSGTTYQSYDQIKDIMLKEINEASKQPNSSCIFFGWDPELIPGLPVLSATFLDEEFTKEIPILVWGQSGHVAWVNHKAFEVASIYDSTDNPNGGIFVKDGDGKLTGQLLESPAILAVVKHIFLLPSENAFSQAVKKQWKDYSKWGFTTITDLSYSNKNDMFNKVLENESKRKRCPVRVALYVVADMKDGVGGNKPTAVPHCCTMPLEFANLQKDANELVENEKLWVQGYKIFADGSPHSGTMATREPYLRSNLTEILGFPPVPDSYGHQNYSWNEIYNTVKSYYVERGKQVAVHAHGERAIDRVMSVFEKVLKDENDETNAKRHRMEHLGLITGEQVVRAGKINLGLSFFVSHLYFYAKTYSESILGRERTNRWAPLSLATKHDVCWSLHQDHPTFPGHPNPFESIRTAVTRTQRDDEETVYGPEYRVSIHEALKAYTINAAWQLNKEGELGSLEEGKKADLVILSDNPYKVDPFKLVEDIKVLDTFIDGCRNEISPLDTIQASNDINIYY